MKRLRAFLVACLVAGLAITALGAPAAAAEKTKLAIVNGMPGQKVAICVNGKRVARALPYGKYTFRTVYKPRATIKFLKPGPTTKQCKGVRIKKKVVDYADATVVVTKGSDQRVVVLDNYLFWATTFDIGIGYAHAGDMGMVNVNHDRKEFFGGGASGVDAHMLRKGDLAQRSFADDGKHWFDAVIAHVPTTGRIVAGPIVKRERSGYRWEFIVVGTTWNNLRMVVFQRRM